MIKGETKGNHHHPQLIRFRLHPDPLCAVVSSFVTVAAEVEYRGYAFDRSRIGVGCSQVILPVTRGQFLFEWLLLRAKLQRRTPFRYEQTIGLDMPEIHPMFDMIEGDIAEWERAGKTA